MIALLQESHCFTYQEGQLVKILKHLCIVFFLLSFAPLSSGVPDKPNPRDGNAQERHVGVWNGVYYYPDDAKTPVKFEMIVIQNGATVAGFMKEPNTFGKRNEPLLHAVFKGRIDDETGQWKFTKTYDGTAGENHDVAYEGKTSREGTKVEGTWKLNDLVGRFTLEKGAQTRAGAYTGIWSGTFHYPRGDGRDAVNFNMILVHEGKGFTGFMKEPNTFGNGDEPWLQAGFKGRIDEETGRLMITKTYDGTGGVSHAVEYSGMPARDGSKIEGSWTIGDFGGPFVLQRLRLDARTVETLK
jgi:hypothetical protein